MRIPVLASTLVLALSVTACKSSDRDQTTPPSASPEYGQDDSYGQDTGQDPEDIDVDIEDDDDDESPDPDDQRMGQGKQHREGMQHGEGMGHGPMADDEFAGRQVVPNYDATTGDVTICPYSGRKFEVKADSPRIDWNGKSWVLCCQDCVPKVQAEPEKYLGKYLTPTPAPTPIPTPIEEPVPTQPPGSTTGD